MLFWSRLVSVSFVEPFKGLLPLLLLCAVVSLSAVEPDAGNQQRYYSPTEFTLEYPLGWDRIDKTNVESVSKELTARETQLSPEYLAAWRSAVRRIVEQRCSAVIWNASNTSEFSAVDILVAKKEIPIKLGSQKQLQAELQKNLLPSGLSLKRSVPALRKFGKSQYLSLLQEFESRERGEVIANQSYLLKGNKRSLIISCTADAPTLNSLKPVMASLRTSLRDVREVNRGLVVLPQWLELSIIGLFALVVVVMIRKTVSEYSPKIRSHYDKAKKLNTLGFLGLVVLVWLILVGATILFKI